MPLEGESTYGLINNDEWSSGFGNLYRILSFRMFLRPNITSNASSLWISEIDTLPNVIAISSAFTLSDRNFWTPHTLKLWLPEDCSNTNV